MQTRTAYLNSQDPGLNLQWQVYPVLLYVFDLDGTDTAIVW